MGYQVGSQCFDSAGSALQAMAASMFGTGVSSDGTPLTYYSVAGDTDIVTYTSIGTAARITPTLIECQLIDPSTTAALCFAVLGLWAIAYKFRAANKALQIDTRGE